jgi:hypothetical protein
MQNNNLKNQNMQIPSVEGGAAKPTFQQPTFQQPTFQQALKDFFTNHSFEDAEDALADLLQIWISPDTETVYAPVEIANRAFFVANLNTFIRKTAGFDLSNNLELPESDPARLYITSFFDQWGVDYPEESLNATLQSWICPDQDDTQYLNHVADVVGLFWDLNILLRKCEQVFLTVEGGDHA